MLETHLTFNYASTEIEIFVFSNARTVNCYLLKR